MSEEFSIPKKFYVAPGLRDKFAAANGTTADQEKTLVDLKQKIIDLKNAYSDESFTMISFSKADRVAIRISLANYFFTRCEQDRIFSDLEVADKLVSVLPDLLTFVFKVEKLHQLISRVEKFIEELSERNKSALGDFVGALKKWISDGVPDKPSANDLVLISILEETRKEVPGEVAEKHKKNFLIDRLERIEKIRLSI